MALDVLSDRVAHTRDRTREDRRSLGSRASRSIFGVPARFMMPRIVLAVSAFTLLALGLLMIYSASSIEALTSAAYNYDATYFVVRQACFAAVGLVIAAVAIVLDYHVVLRWLLWPLWIISVGLLIALVATTSGTEAYGATRWLSIAGISVQPSEFAKVVVILTGIHLAMRYFDDQSITPRQFLALSAIGVGIPLALILFQPDKGTTLICCATLMVMAYLAGMPTRTLIKVGILALIVVLWFALKDDYSRRRFLVAINPKLDEFDTGYQPLHGLYAFATGGITGVGIGMSRQKYAYIPFAYNDFIYAVIGEELGLIGTLGVLVAFAALAWAGFEIARYAPDLAGRLLAAGCTSMLIIQLLVNVSGVLCIIPLSGKTVPFLSYGGSSIISCLTLVGLVGSVSKASRLPETEFDRHRRDVALATDDDVGRPALSLVGEVGEPMPRSQRPAGTLGSVATPLGSAQMPRLARSGESSTPSVADSNPTSPSSIRAQRRLEERTRGRVSVDGNGRRRIDLGPDAAARLRGARSR